MSDAAPILTAAELALLRLLWQSSDGSGHDFGFTSDVDRRAAGLTVQGFAALFGSLERKGAFQWTERDADANGTPVGTQFGLSAWAIKLGAPVTATGQEAAQ